MSMGPEPSSLRPVCRMGAVSYHLMHRLLICSKPDLLSMS